MPNNFADQLRNTTPAPKPPAPDKRTEFRKRQTRTPQQYCNNVIWAFKRSCEEEAKRGKRKAEWGPYMIRVASDSYSYKISYEGWGEKIYAYEYAQEVADLLRKELNVMNFSSYSVSIVSSNSSGFRGRTAYAYSFSIKARW